MMLTAKEVQILKNVKNGLGADDIAELLYRTKASVKAHIVRLCKKLEIEPASQVKLCMYLNCELFRIGLRELGYL